MYGYIKGKVTLIKPGYIIVERDGIGYQILVSNPYRWRLDEDVTVYVYNRFREPDFILYGFPSLEVKEFFLKLISVSGIGPKSALAILSVDDINPIIEAIETGNAKYLTKFPGIGMKSAQQIILDLKGKLVQDPTSIFSPQLEEVEEALLALGYSKTEIKKVMKKLPISDKVEDMVRDALALLLR